MLHHKHNISEIDLKEFGDEIGKILLPEDCLLMHGDLGAGKTTLLRSVIRSWSNVSNLDVPSPTFPFLQTYQGKECDLYHYDFYRLDPQAPDLINQITELGWDEAQSGNIICVEWPDRLHELAPTNALHITIHHHKDDSRDITLQSTDTGWIDRLGL